MAIHYEKNEHIVTITIDRPEARNSLDLEHFGQLADSWVRYRDDEDAYVAILTGVETRTSSPVRITRDNETLQSLNVRGLFPCGEGAGYAGGILSAGVDGIKVAEAVARSISGTNP